MPDILSNSVTPEHHLSLQIPLVKAVSASRSCGASYPPDSCFLTAQESSIAHGMALWSYMLWDLVNLPAEADTAAGLEPSSDLCHGLKSLMLLSPCGCLDVSCCPLPPPSGHQPLGWLQQGL